MANITRKSTSLSRHNGQPAPALLRSNSIHSYSNISRRSNDANSTHSQIPNDYSGFPLSDYNGLGSMWTWSFGDHISPFLPNDKPIRILETWKYGDTSTPPVVKNQEIKEDEIGAWLSEAPPVGEAGSKPAAGYRILQVDSGPDNISLAIPLKGETYKALIDAFKLPPVELHNRSDRQGATGVIEGNDGSYILIVRRAYILSHISIILRYDPETNVSSGYMITNAQPNTPIEAFFDVFSPQFLVCSHPILLPILTIEGLLECAMVDIEEIFQRLIDIEKQTGFSDYEKDSEDEIDYQQVVRRLGELNSYYAANTSALLTFLGSTKILQRKLMQMDGKLCKNEDKDESLEKPVKYSTGLRDRIEYLISSVEQALLYGNLQVRLQAQQQVVFNLIAQSDTKVNIELAKDSRELAAASKQDSSAMKIIAVLTTLFLPGTYVATYFAMPLFNWEESSVKKVSGPYVWLYWAVTAPLTLATMVLVISWALWHRSQYNILVEQARNPIGENEESTDTEATLLPGKKSSYRKMLKHRFKILQKMESPHGSKLGEP
ncbi:hypothetical protein F5884DRAFT_240788 [Xylogone sp. PMI_703]|nr:hypothetical protein F5884DRAFT_240788 [Xylogone sp. PMI_703]